MPKSLSYLLTRLCQAGKHVCLCFICVSATGSVSIRGCIPATILSPDTRRRGNLLPSLSLLLFIYSFIYWLIFLPTPHPGSPQQRSRAEVNCRWGLIFSGMCHAIFWAPQQLGRDWQRCRRLANRKPKGEDEKKLHPSGGRHFLMARGRLVYQAGHHFCVICELNNSLI